MSLTLITPPAVAPVSVAEVRAQCRLRDADTEVEDALLAAYVRAAASWAEGFTSLALITQTWEWVRTAFPVCGEPNALDLPVRPVQSVVSITFTTADGEAQVVAPDQYYLADDRVWPLKPGVPWAYRAGVTIRFVCGFGTDANSIPEAIRQAVAMLAAYWFNQREAASIGPDSGPVSDIPFGPGELLMPYRRVW